MCDANIVSYFKNTLIPAYSGLDSLSRIKVISFLAGISAAYKTNLPLEAKADCREQFNSGRNSTIKGKFLAAFKYGQVNINNAYFDAGLNLAWKTLYDLVYSPVDRSLQDRSSIIILGVDPSHDINHKVVVDMVNIINYEFKHELNGKPTYSYWTKAIREGAMEQKNSVERELIMAEHIGIALGYYLDLPSSDVTSVNSFYEVAHRPQVALFLSAINELININIDETIKVAKAVWLNRADIVAGTFTPVCVLSKLVHPNNEDVPKLFKEEGWLDKIMDGADLFEKMIKEVKSIQDPANADVREAMHIAPEVPVNGFNLMRNLMG